MRLRNLIISLAIVLSIILVPSFTSAHETGDPNHTHETVDVYGMFWPIVPGTTVADSTFFLKQIRETFSGLFKTSNLAKAEYQTELSEKRFVEAFKLFEAKDYDNAFKSLQMNQENRKVALEAKRKAKEANQDVLGVSTEMVKSLENQQKALVFIQSQVPQNEQTQLQPQIDQLTLQISEAK